MLATVGRRAIVPSFRTLRPVTVCPRVSSVQRSFVHTRVRQQEECPQPIYVTVPESAVTQYQIASALNEVYESFMRTWTWLTAVPEETVEQEEAAQPSYLSSFLLARGTYKPHFKKRKRTFGFLKRLSTHGGRKVLERRQAKGRQRMAA
jgi:large subunit ribosomal protein L34